MVFSVLHFTDEKLAMTVLEDFNTNGKLLRMVVDIKTDEYYIQGMASVFADVEKDRMWGVNMVKY